MHYLLVKMNKKKVNKKKRDKNKIVMICSDLESKMNIILSYEL